jgi:hypothetical protein
MRASRLPIVVSALALFALLGAGCLVQPAGSVPADEGAREAPNDVVFPGSPAGEVVTTDLTKVIGAKSVAITRTAPGVTLSGPTPDPWHGGSQSGPTPDPWDPDHRRTPDLGAQGSNAPQGSDTPVLDQRPPR